MVNNLLSFLVKKFGISNSSFNDRIISQKMIFILQEMGLGTNYNFKWYLYGVYSSELAQDIFEGNYGGEKITKEKEEILLKFSSLIKEDINNPSFLETLSSIIYFLKNNPFLSKEEVFNKLGDLKPHLKDLEQFNRAYLLSQEILKRA